MNVTTLAYLRVRYSSAALDVTTNLVAWYKHDIIGFIIPNDDMEVYNIGMEMLLSIVVLRHG